MKFNIKKVIKDFKEELDELNDQCCVDSETVYELAKAYADNYPSEHGVYEACLMSVDIYVADVGTYVKGGAK